MISDLLCHTDLHLKMHQTPATEGSVSPRPGPSRFRNRGAKDSGCYVKVVEDFRAHMLMMKVGDKKGTENAKMRARKAAIFCRFMGCDGQSDLSALKNLDNMTKWVVHFGEPEKSFASTMIKQTILDVRIFLKHVKMRFAGNPGYRLSKNAVQQLLYTLKSISTLNAKDVRVRQRQYKVMTKKSKEELTLQNLTTFKEYAECKTPKLLDFPLLPECKEEVSPEQQEKSLSLVQEEPPLIKEEQEEELLQTPEEAAGTILTLLIVKSEDDDENQEIEPLASTSTEHMKTQADAEDCGTPTSNDQLVSSHGSESDTDDSDDWVETREALNTLKSHKTQHAEEQRSSLSNKLSQDLKSSKQTPSMRSHTGKKIYSCTECGKMFFYLSCLKHHMRIHTDENPITCKVCERSFSKNFDLKRHMTIHTGERPFTCQVCERSFLRNEHLKRHMITHTVEKAKRKKHTCTKCGEVYSNMGNLKQHVRIHTGEKLFGHMSHLKEHEDSYR